VPNLTVLYVMAKNQINPKARKFLDDHHLKPFHFLSDADDRVIDQFGIRNTDEKEGVERGVPYPTTYVLDRDGIIRLKDSRKDYQIWLSASKLKQVLSEHGDGGS